MGEQLKDLAKVANLGSISQQLNLRYGDRSCISGTEALDDAQRLPTGVFTFDYATGGGFPIHQYSLVKGPEHGGKTSLLMSAMAKVAKICWRCFRPLGMCSCSLSSVRMKSVWCDVEGTFNKFWAQSIGCDPEDYYLNVSDAGNQYGDIIDYSLRADDCGLVILDSVAALFPSDMMDSSLDDKVIGNQAKLVTNLINKVNSRLSKEYKRGHPCLVLLTNQLRANIGVFYGPSTTQPGGYAIRFFSALTIHISKKALQDKEKYYDKEKDLHMAQKHSFYIEKFKSLKLSESGEFIRVTANIPELDFSRGDIIDHKLVITELLNHGLMTKGTTKYTMGKSSGSQKDFVEMWKKNKDLYFETQFNLINTIKDKIINKSVKTKATKEAAACPDESVAVAEKQ
jgi:recombination protein RecA